MGGSFMGRGSSVGSLALLALLAVGVGACAGAPVVRPGPAFPDRPAPGVVHAEGRFDGVDELSLFRQSWRPEGEPRAVLVVVHGLKDHSSRYAALAERLATKGFAVHAFDLRGHGRSDGDRVEIESFDEYLDDLGHFLELVRAEEPGKPLFLFGHSMGGAIVTLFTLTRKPELAGLVLSGAALKVGEEVSTFLVGVTGFLATVAPGLPVLALDDQLFSRDPSVVAAMKTDPFIDDGAGPARTASELLGAIEEIQAGMERLAVPLLILHGGADKLTNPDGSRELQQRAASSDKTLKLYDGFFHDLLHEPGAERVLADVASWLEARAPASAATSALPPPAPPSP